MRELLEKLTKSGIKTSEFWVAIAALLLPYVLEIPQDQATGWAVAHGGAWAGYIVAAVYIGARAYMKGKQIQALGSDALAGSQAADVLEQFPGPVVTLELRRQLAIAQAAVAQNIKDPAVLEKIVAEIAAAARSSDQVQG